MHQLAPNLFIGNCVELAGICHLTNLCNTLLPKLLSGKIEIKDMGV